LRSYRNRNAHSRVNVASVIDARRESVERVMEEVASVVFGGGLVIFPTDTVYGIGCDPYDLESVDRIYGAKHRPDHKPLSFHVASPAEFLEFVHDNKLALLAAKRLLPGPVTLIVRRPAFVSEDVTSGMPTLGFRVPDDSLCRAILERCGPLAATSANASGERAYRGEGEHDRLPPADLLVENGPTRYQLESTVLDLTGPHAWLLREGVVPLEAVAERIGPTMRQAAKDRTAQL
jgi:L-threonylcarbamoyladenylate synthase